MTDTFYALQKLRASALQALVDDTVKAYKFGNTDRPGTTTLTADPHLVLPLKATYVYTVIYTLYYVAPAAADIKFAIDYPTGADPVPFGGLRMVDTSAGLVGDVDPGAYSDAVDATDFITAGGTGLNAFCILSATVDMDTTAGDLTLQWAQRASSGTTTLLQGSSAIAWRHR